MYAVARNLLANAIDFGRPGTPPRVEVAADRRDGRWRVEVTDNGVGVAPDQRETMFVLFARADKRSGGSGIGLAAAKRIVEAHGGRIGMDAAAGGGTTVWFDLPV
jgi:signal transduction histidine kinase